MSVRVGLHFKDKRTGPTTATAFVSRAPIAGEHMLYNEDWYRVEGIVHSQGHFAAFVVLTGPCKAPRNLEAAKIEIEAVRKKQIDGNTEEEA